jgi:hypothetical protein
VFRNEDLLVRAYAGTDFANRVDIGIEQIEPNHVTSDACTPVFLRAENCSGRSFAKDFHKRLTCQKILQPRVEAAVRLIVMVAAVDVNCPAGDIEITYGDL